LDGEKSAYNKTIRRTAANTGSAKIWQKAVTPAQPAFSFNLGSDAIKIN
jgi:hypothetical protein